MIDLYLVHGSSLTHTHAHISTCTHRNWLISRMWLTVLSSSTHTHTHIFTHDHACIMIDLFRVYMARSPQFLDTHTHIYTLDHACIIIIDLYLVYMGLQSQVPPHTHTSHHNWPLMHHNWLISRVHDPQSQVPRHTPADTDIIREPKRLLLPQQSTTGPHVPSIKYLW